MNLQNEHLKKFLNLIGVRNGTKIPGFVRMPPSKFQRVQQEFGWLRALYYWGTRNLALCITGKRLVYFRGNVRVEQRPTLKIIFRAVRGRKTIISIPTTHTISSPLSNIYEDLSFDEKADIHAKVGFNTAIVLFAKLAELPIVLHCPTSDDSAKLIYRHRQGVQTVSSCLKGTSLEQFVPKFVTLRHAQSEFCAQTLMVGFAPDFKQLDADEYDLRICSALKWITDLHLLTFDPASKPSMPALELLNHDSFGYKTDLINRVIEAVSKWIEYSEFGSVLVHGDYWLGNVLFHEESHRLSAVVDWEWCENAGLPGLDALQLVLMSRCRLSKDSFPSMLRYLFEVEKLDPTDHKALKQIRRMCQYEESDMRYLTMYLWLDTLRRGYVETQPENTSWFDDNTTIPLPCFIDWLEHAGDKIVN